MDWSVCGRCKKRKVGVNYVEQQVVVLFCCRNLYNGIIYLFHWSKEFLICVTFSLILAFWWNDLYLPVDTNIFRFSIFSFSSSFTKVALWSFPWTHFTCQWNNLSHLQLFVWSPKIHIFYRLQTSLILFYS